LHIWIKLQALLQQLLPCEEEGFDDFVFINLLRTIKIDASFLIITIKVAAIVLI